MMYLNATSSAPMLAECKALPGPYNLSCIGGVAVAFIEHGLAGSAYERDLTACNDPSLTAPEKDTCFRYFGSAIKDWYPKEQVAQICTEFPPEFQKYCTP